MNSSMIDDEKAREIATKEAVKRGYDSVEFVTKDGEYLVFVMMFLRELNDIPDTGLPAYVLVSENKVDFYCGFKYSKQSQD